MFSTRKLNIISEESYFAYYFCIFDYDMIVGIPDERA